MPQLRHRHQPIRNTDLSETSETFERACARVKCLHGDDKVCRTDIGAEDGSCCYSRWRQVSGCFTVARDLGLETSPSQRACSLIHVGKESTSAPASDRPQYTCLNVSWGEYLRATQRELDTRVFHHQLQLKTSKTPVQCPNLSHGRSLTRLIDLGIDRPAVLNVPSSALSASFRDVASHVDPRRHGNGSFRHLSLMLSLMLETIFPVLTPVHCYLCLSIARLSSQVPGPSQSGLD